MFQKEVVYQRGGGLASFLQIKLSYVTRFKNILCTYLAKIVVSPFFSHEE